MTGDTAIDTRPSLLRLSYGGVRHELAANPEWTLQTLAEQLAERCGVDPATIKLLRKKEKVPLVPTSQPDRLLSDTGRERCSRPANQLGHMRQRCMRHVAMLHPFVFSVHRFLPD